MVSIQDLRKHAKIIKNYSEHNKDCKHFKMNFVHLCRMYIEENYLFWDYFTLSNLNAKLSNQYYDGIMVFYENKIIDYIILL